MSILFSIVVINIIIANIFVYVRVIQRIKNLETTINILKIRINTLLPLKSPSHE